MAISDIILMSLVTSIPILYTFPMILAHFFKIQGYKISDQTECNQRINKLQIQRSVFTKMAVHSVYSMENGISDISRDENHEKDASVLRDGRIDKAYHMKRNK